MPMANAIFLNQVQTNKNYYNKFQTKKRPCFAGRTGDWKQKKDHVSLGEPVIGLVRIVAI